MGDANMSITNQNLFEDEDQRLNSFGDKTFSVDKHLLAKAGFVYTRNGNIVQCYVCPLEFDAKEIDPAICIVTFHKESNPDCSFAKQLVVPRSKRFVSYDSLRYEKERLETFIDWPISWLKPDELARDGFYFLRTADHCACVFCRGIVGAWEHGDTPRGEHKRHFPHCPFVRGQAVGNIPIEHSSILSKLSPSPTAPQQPSTLTVDICGTPRHMPGSYPEGSGGPKAALNYQSLGCSQFSEPKRKDFLTYESRLGSYNKWPELVTQRPKDLAAAGFFYCGLSDHVRCFHCGNGLRNWEADDEPWQEHARWYPDCTFVRLTKGQDFIDQVRREKPPYIRSQPSNRPASSSSTSAKPNNISEKELEPLMQLDIIKAVLGMGFPQDKVKAALQRKLEQTGLPFFSLEPCIEAVLQYMEEETRRTLQERANQEVEEEARAQQAKRLQAASEQQQPAVSTVESSSSHTSTTTSATVTSSTSAGVSTSSPVLSAPTSVSEPSTLVSVSTTPSLSTTEASTSTAEGEMEVDEPPTAAAASVASATETAPQPMDVITQANEVIEMAEEALKPTTSGSPPVDQTEKSNDEQATGEKEQSPEQPSTSKSLGNVAPVAAQSTEKLAEELEKIRDSRMCKVCMDADMDVVFLPCQHMVTCSSCAVAMSSCPICREAIKFYIKPILS